jgi:hypothetical protein
MLSDLGVKIFLASLTFKKKNRDKILSSLEKDQAKIIFSIHFYRK